MHEDLGGLRRSLESGVERPSFDSLAERADAIGRRRRTRRVVLASSVAAAAIVLAAVVAASVPGADEHGYAGPASPGPANPSTTASPEDREEHEVPTYAYRPAGSEPVRVHLPKKLFGSVGPKKAAVELKAATTAGEPKRVEYFAFAQRAASGAWESIYSDETAAPQCRGLGVRQTGFGTVLELPRHCLPVRGTASRWTALGPPSGGLRSAEFVVTPS